MAMRMPEVEETALNMTPMIDIVFQLIVFFLLTLKFVTPEHKIDSQLPKDRGLAATPQFVSDLQAIKVKLFRKDKDDPVKAFTKIKVGNNWETKFPAGQWKGAGDADSERMAEYDRVMASLKAKILEEWERGGKDPEQKGEISAPPPDGPSVPHGDVVKVLDAFLELGIKTVNFQGAMAPISRSEDGIGAATGR
jgi:biopolymer transport protein ExbD